MHGRVNHVTAEEAQGDKDVVLGTFLINSVPATVLFDSEASHSFITERFVTKHDAFGFLRKIGCDSTTPTRVAGVFDISTQLQLVSTTCYIISRVSMTSSISS
jgi:hypothetical protein